MLKNTGVDTKGYSYLKTPTLLPGVEGLSPLMTYGKIASTPKLLDDDARGPNFMMAEETERELAAEKLQRGATQRQRESKQLTKAERLRVLGLSVNGTPTTPGSMRTPTSVISKVTPLSPIGQLIQRAQKLAQRGGQLHIGNSCTRGRSTKTS